MSNERDPNTDQQLPKEGQQDVFPRISAEFNDCYNLQYQKGIQKYGKTLQTFNGRDAGQDAFEEWFDLGVYMKQLHMEHQEIKKLLVEAKGYLLGYKDTLESPTELPNLINRIEKML